MLHFKIVILLMLLTLSLAQEDELILPIVSEDQFHLALDSVRQLLKEEGRWSNELHLRSVSRNEKGIQSRWSIVTGKPLLVDTVILSGVEELNRRTIAQLTQIPPNIPANKTSLIKLHKSIIGYSFLRDAGQPFYARRQDKGLSAIIPVKANFLHSIIAVVGVQPSSQEKGQITGDVQIRIENPLGSASKTRFWWNRKDNQSQRLSLGYEDPIIWRLNIGGSFSFSQILQDGLYVQRETAIAVVLPHSFLGKVSIGGTEESVKITEDGDSLGLLGHSIRSLTIKLEKDSRNTRHNPTSGRWIRINLGLGDYLTDSNERTISLDLKSEGEFLKPISDELLLSIAGWGGYFGLASGIVPLSEKLRYGGASTLRGYDEQVFQADWVVVGQFELRYIVGSYTQFFAFFDSAYDALKRTPASAGFGYQQNTPLGILRLAYALGKDDIPAEGKIHIGMINRF